MFVPENEPSKAPDDIDAELLRSLRRIEDESRRSTDGIIKIVILALAAVSVGIAASFLMEFWRQAAAM